MQTNGSILSQKSLPCHLIAMQKHVMIRVNWDQPVSDVMSPVIKVPVPKATIVLLQQRLLRHKSTSRGMGQFHYWCWIQEGGIGKLLISSCLGCELWKLYTDGSDVEAGAAIQWDTYIGSVTAHHSWGRHLLPELEVMQSAGSVVMSASDTFWSKLIWKPCLRPVTMYKLITGFGCSVSTYACTFNGITISA